MSNTYLTPYRALRDAIRSSNLQEEERRLKALWPEASEFLQVLSAHLLTVVADPMTGRPLLELCLRNSLPIMINGTESTASHCSSDACVIKSFVDRATRYIPVLLFWDFVCEDTKERWDPFEFPLNKWLEQHQNFQICEKCMPYSAEEARIFRDRIVRNMLSEDLLTNINRTQYTPCCQTIGT